VTFGTSIFVFAVGAILRYAVTATVSGINIHTVGLILMIVGVVGFLVSVFYALSMGSRRVARERVIERDPPRTY
jgi:beta-lactamase regulating signal transducer with metallopeptidase domain